MAHGSAMDVAGLARSYYDDDGIHNVVNALAYGQDHESDLQATGTLTVNKSLFISPAACGLAAGTEVNATGTMTLNGVLQACRNEDEGCWPDASGMAATFTARVVKTAPGDDVVCYNGTVHLVGLGDGVTEPWVLLLPTAWLLSNSTTLRWPSAFRSSSGRPFTSA
jgi:hypothetical protein